MILIIPLKAGVDLKQVVKVPENETFNDWLAVHVVDFFNRIQILYGTVYEVCTEESCPVMSGGPKYEYLWQDGQRYEATKAHCVAFSFTSLSFSGTRSPPLCRPTVTSAS